MRRLHPLSHRKIRRPGWRSLASLAKRRHAGNFFLAIPATMDSALLKRCTPKCFVWRMSTYSAPSDWPKQRNGWPICWAMSPLGPIASARKAMCTSRKASIQALQRYEIAIALLERLDRELDIGRTLTSGLQALIYLGRYDQAFEWAERARGIFERHGDQLRLARLKSNMGNILYRQDRHVEALHYYNQAREPLGRLGEPRDLAAVLSNMAVCCTSLGWFTDAVSYYEAARDHCVRHGLPLLVAAADYNIAYLYYLRGDYIRAMRLYRVSRAHAEQAGDFYHAALCDLDESEMCLELNLTDEGGQLAKRAAVKFDQMGMQYERAKAVVNQSLAASRGGDLGGALRLLRQARRLFTVEQNQVWPAIIDLYQAILRYQQGRYSDAQRLSGHAARLLSSSAMHSKAALCKLLQAQLLWKAGQLEQAREACRHILEHLDPDLAPSLRFHVNFVLGQVEEQLENWAGAWTAYQDARRQIESLRSRLWGDELKISILKDKLEVYEALVWLM